MFTTLWFGGLRQTIELNCMLHVQHDYFFSFNQLRPLFSGVLAAVSLKAVANEGTLLRTHCCSWCFLGSQTRGTQNECCVPCCANWEPFVANKKYFWTKSEAFCVRNKCCPRTNGETFVWATMCPQQCVLVCQRLELTFITIVSCRRHQHMKLTFKLSLCICIPDPAG